MKETRILMGMHVTIEIVDATVTTKDIDDIYDYFKYIDEKFSTYKETSEISQINNGKLRENQYSADMKVILSLCKQTKAETNGYFDIVQNGKIDPSGIVKGWSIWQAAKILSQKGFKNFYVDAGGDVQVSGKNTNGEIWTVGIKNPFNQSEIIKVLALDEKGIATSGTYIRGNHIYNPYQKTEKLDKIVSITVIGQNVYEADRFATAAFAMGREGINFLERLPNLEAYMIDKSGIGTYTSGFEKFVVS